MTELERPGRCSYLEVESEMSLAEILLVAGTFGICLGVWVTLGVIIRLNG